MSSCRRQHLNLKTRGMVFTVRTLVFCYLLGVHVSGDEININGSVENTANANDASLPKVHIVVRTYAKAEVVRDDTQEKDGERGDISKDLPNDIKSQHNGEMLNDGASELTSDSQESIKFNEPENSGGSNSENHSRTSFISESLEKISGIATLAWDYVTQAEGHTPRPDPGNNPPRSGVTEGERQSFETGIIDDGTGENDVYFEDEQIKNTQVNQEILPKKGIHNHDIEIPKGKTSLDKVSNEIISNNDEKLDKPTHRIKDKPETHLRKGKTENSKFKPFSFSHSRNNVRDSKVWKSPKQHINISGQNTSSSKSQLDEKVNDTDAGRKGSSNETAVVDDGEENQFQQADQSSFLDFILGGTEAKPTSANKHLDKGPEDAELDDDMDNAFPVSGYDGDLSVVERPLVNAIDYRGYNSRKPVPETDLRSEGINHLIDYYDRCDTCMVHNTSRQCHYYTEHADEFDKWARYYTDVLRYGCSNTDESNKQRCCHGPQTITQTTLREINQLVKSIYNVLWNQCHKCPVDCSWSEWQSWNSCPSNCGIGATRNRTRTQRSEQYGGQQCQGSDLQQDRCSVEFCNWLSWSPWSECSSTCGGTRHRSRRHTHSNTHSCFISCEGKNTEVESCGNPSCCHFRQWSQWGQWADCDVATDTRARHHRRWRSCEADPRHIDEPMCPDPCPGPEFDRKECCIPAAWGEWGSWSERLGIDRKVDLETGEPCGKGCSNRTRICNYGTCPGGTCYGDDIERMFFNLTPCCEPPNWSQWCPWAECSVTCGLGIRRRSRECQADPDKWRSPICKAGGCYGQPDKFEVEDCGKTCPCVQPSWGAWGNWGECDFQRANPRRTRARHCHKSPDSSCQHLECPGDAEMEEPCQCQPPFWEAWNQWGSCNRNVIPPSRQRQRNCRRFSNPAYCPKDDCVGDAVENERCCGRQEWGSWHEWSQCDHRSNPHVTTRIRFCNSPDPGCPNESCPGPDRERKECKLPPCGRQEWGTWHEWSQCDHRSNPPVRTRIRYCSSPDPGCPNGSCPGLDREREQCKPDDCDHGHWHSWGSWSRCDCNTKSRSRTRTKHSQIHYLHLCPPFSDTQHQSCEPDCSNCSCNNREDGKYPSCIPGCRHYITCCQGVATTDKCIGDQQYDSLCMECTRSPSPTCPDGQFDLYKNEVHITKKPQEECRK